MSDDRGIRPDPASGPDDREEPPSGSSRGGLAGFFATLQAMGETPEDIDDPAALRAAEAAVARDDDQPGVPKPAIDEAWQTVATHDGAGGLAGLEYVARALGSEGVTVGWDPYNPFDEVGFMPPGMSARVYSLQVPVSQVGTAREVLHGFAPEGVTYGWAPEQRPASALDTEPAEPEYGFGAAGTRPTPRIDDPTISDNQRLERLAQSGPSGLAMALALVCTLLVIGVVVYVLLHR
jgi:hypothetical protein